MKNLWCSVEDGYPIDPDSLNEYLVLDPEFPKIASYVDGVFYDVFTDEKLESVDYWQKIELPD